MTLVVELRGVATAATVDDRLPIIESFRRVSSGTVLGLWPMDMPDP